MSDTINGNIQGFAALVQQQAAAMQVAAATASPGRVLTFSPGSILRAVCQAVAGVALWLQGLALNLLLYARASTATGADLDSWMADFQFTRIQGATARCSYVTLTRYATSQPAVILLGGLVQTADGSQQFTIIADPTQTGYSPTAGGYVMAAGVATVQVTVQNTVQGAAGNVAANTITAFASGIVGADTVTNTVAATGGADPETDSSFRARFWNYLQYLFKATDAANIFAAQSVQAGLTATIVDNYDEAGNWKPGYFYITLDDGTGYPPASLLDAASAVVETTRASTVGYAVHAPAVVTVNVAATVNLTAGYTSGQVLGPAEQNGAGWVNSMVLGQNLSYWKTGSAIENTPGVAELVSLTIAGGTIDITATVRQKIVAGAVVVTVA